MKLTHVVVIALLTGALGFLLGSLTSDGSSHPTPILGNAEADDPDLRADTNLPPIRTPRPRVDRPNTDASAEDSNPARNKASLVKLLDAEIAKLEHDEDAMASVPVGEGRIFGRVLDDKDTAIEGVTLYAWFARTDESDSYSRLKKPQNHRDTYMEYIFKDENEVAAEAVHERRSYRKVIRKTVTDSSGAFSFDGLGDVTAYISPFLAGYNFDNNELYSIAPSAQELIIRAGGMVALDVTVLLPEGKEPEWCTLSLTSTDENSYGSNSDGWNPKDRRLWVQPGTYKIRANYDIADRYFAADDIICDATGSGPVPVTVQLAEDTSLEVTIVRAWNFRPVHSRNATFSVHYSRADGATNSASGSDNSYDSMDLKISSSEYYHSARSNVLMYHGNQSVQTARGLKPGVYNLDLIVGEDYSSKRKITATVTLAQGANKVSLTYEKPAPGNLIALRVLDPSGNLLTSEVGVSADISVGDGDYHRSGEAYPSVMPVLDDQSNTLILLSNLAPLGNDQKYVLTINASHPKFPDTSITLNNPFPPGAELKFSEVASATIRALGLTNLPKGGQVYVQLAPRIEGDKDWYSYSGEQRSMNKDGGVEFKSLAVGDYTLRAFVQIPSEDYYRSKELVTQDITLRAGANTLDFTIPALQDLTITGLTPGSSAYIASSGESEGYSQDSAEVNSKGEAIFKGMIAGEYTVSADGGTMTVRIPSGGPVAFVSTNNNAMLVSITDVNGALAKAGLQDGDIVLIIGGLSCADISGPREFILMVQSLEKTEWTVVRGGNLTKLSIDLHSATEFGGSFTPTAWR